MEFLLDLSYVRFHPGIDVSTDGKPLATSITDLLWNFPYDRLSSNSLVANLLRPEVVFILIAFYITSKGPVLGIRDHFGTTGESDMFKLLAAVHNAVMQTFSIVVSVNVWSLVTDHVEAHGMGATYCDAEGSLWDAGFGSWSTVWYLSFYYQFIDAWIMVLKGKQIPDMLLYHHAFMIVILWGGIVTHSSWLPAIVLLSSISQITNYTEHFIKSMLPSMESRGVHFLATIKFLQFSLGVMLTFGTQVLGSACASQASRFVLGLLQLFFVGWMVWVFVIDRKKEKNE